MKERPILFGAPMVKAILAGAKTMTRRILTPQPEHLQRHEWRGKVLYDAEHRIWWWKQHHFENLIDFEDGRRELAQLCRYGVVGDRLWVREGIKLIARRGDEHWGLPDEDLAVYVADESVTLLDTWPWKRTRLPGIHMPRGLCRLELDITNVRVERLQDISEEDAKAEGAAYRIAPGGDLAGAFQGLAGDIGYRAHFADLWRSINGAESWDANPWVWVVEFRRLEQARSAA